MSARGGRILAYVAFAALFLLHNDLWLWRDADRVFGLPAGLAYHLVYCLAAAGVMALLVRFAWPKLP